jgi:transcriptional regulator with XRE-family HTH domain
VHPSCAPHKRQATLCLVSTLQDRLRWVLETRNLAAGALSVNAGLARSHIGGILRGNEESNLRESTARKIAKAADVSVAWLMTGQGPREPYVEAEVVPLYPNAVVSSGDPYPSRTQVLLLLRGTVPDKVLDALRVVTPAGGLDPGREWWIQHARELVRDLRAIEAEFGSEELSAPASPAHVEEQQARRDTARAVEKTRPPLNAARAERGAGRRRPEPRQGAGPNGSTRPKTAAT